MKGIRFLPVFCLGIFGLLFLGCNNTKGMTAPKNTAGTVSVKLPEKPPAVMVSLNPALVEIKEKMFIAQTNDVYLNPEEYLGKTIKLEGLFKSEKYADSDTAYCFVLRYGPGCCGSDGNVGFEVAWDGQDTDLPYPQDDDWVEAVGVLKSYEEDGYPYLYLAVSSLDRKERRGSEFVTQ